MKALAARGMPKEHPEFKELFGWVTRGVGFAVVRDLVSSRSISHQSSFAQRQKMKTVKVGKDEAQRLVDVHVQMYFDGFGGPDGKG